MEKPGSDDWKNFSWKKFKEQAKDIPRAAGKEISALLRGEKTYKTIDEMKKTAAVDDTKKMEEIKAKIDKITARPATGDETTFFRVEPRAKTLDRYVPPPMRASEAPRPLTAVEQDMEDSFNARPAGSEVGATLKAGTIDARPLTAEEVRARDRENMLLAALDAAKTKTQQDRIYAQLYAPKGKQSGGQHPNP